MQMNLLAGRTHRKAVVSGEILLNGRTADQSALRQCSAYVQQEDSLPPTETVFECLMFSAQLRMPAALSKQKRRECVDQLIVDMVCHSLRLRALCCWPGV